MGDAGRAVVGDAVLHVASCKGEQQRGAHRVSGRDGVWFRKDQPLKAAAVPSLRANVVSKALLCLRRMFYNRLCSVFICGDRLWWSLISQDVGNTIKGQLEETSMEHYDESRLVYTKEGNQSNVN